MSQQQPQGPKPSNDGNFTAGLILVVVILFIVAAGILSEDHPLDFLVSLIFGLIMFAVFLLVAAGVVGFIWHQQKITQADHDKPFDESTKEAYEETRQMALKLWDAVVVEAKKQYEEFQEWRNPSARNDDQHPPHQ